jgi:hypothetical protein
MGAITFDLNFLVAFELGKIIKEYAPIVISLNYNDNGQQYAQINYGVFTKNAQGDVNGVKIEKQIVIVSATFQLN